MKALLHNTILPIVVFFLVGIGTIQPSFSQMTSRPVSALGVGSGGVVVTDSLYSLAMYGVTYKKELSELDDYDLTNNVPKSTDLNLLGTPAPTFCFCTCIKKTILRIEFDDYGDNALDFRNATNTWSSSIVLNISVGTNTPLVCTLNINQMKPEEVFEKDITSMIPLTVMCTPPNGTTGDITVTTGWSNYNAPSDNNAKQAIRLRVHLISEMQVNPDVLSTSCASGYKTIIKDLDVSNASNGNPLRLEWEVKPNGGTGTSCADNVYVPNYQLQILRLFNMDPMYETNENHIREVVNWSNALSIETNSPLQYVDLTIAEGRGFYIWRVRPIGNSEEGGIANPKNWGKWNENSIPDGATLVLGRNIGTGAKLFDGLDNMSIYTEAGQTEVIENHSKKDIFFYRQFDDDRNWIFSRTFTEGAKEYGPQFNEKMTYANLLLQPTQQQVALQSKNSILVSYTGYDFAGRPVIKSLPAALPSRSISYVKSILTQNGSDDMYSAFQFDNSVGSGGSMLTEPASAAPISTSTTPVIHSVGSYYSNSNAETTIPSAEGNSGSYPFTRTIYSSDPLGRVAEQSGVGPDFLIGSGHTVRTQYFDAPENELLSVLGDEAPRPSSTFKTITTDPNGVVSVAYSTADGKTVATCLMKNDLTNSPLLDLQGETVNSIQVMSTASGNQKKGEYEFFSTTKFFLSKQSTCTLDYTITRNNVSVSCPGLCKVCDYIVNIELIGDNGVVESFNIPLLDTSCTETNPTSHNINQHTVSLPAGTYTLNRTIRANNTIKITTSDGDIYKTRLESYVDEQTPLLRLKTQQVLTSIFDNHSTSPIAASRILEHPGRIANIPTDRTEAEDYIASFYDNLYDDYVKNRNLKISQAPYTPTVNLGGSFSCYTIDLPEPEVCENPCSNPNGIDFETYLKVNGGYANNGDIDQYLQEFRIKSPTQNPSPSIVEIDGLVVNSVNVYKKDLIGTLHGGAEGKINTIIANMINTEGGGYSCRKLWRCWQAAVTSFNETMTKQRKFKYPPDALGDTPKTKEEQDQKDAEYDPKDKTEQDFENQDFNLLETFLDCAGRKFCRKAANYNEYIARPYMYVRNDGLYANLYDACVTDIFGATPPLLECNGNTVNDKQVHERLDMVWQCMNLKIQTALADYKSNIPGTIEYRMKNDRVIKPDICDPASTAFDYEECMKSSRDKAENSCKEKCAVEAATARVSLIKQYEDANYLLENKKYTISGQTVIPHVGATLPAPYQLLSTFTLDCMVANALKYCESLCKLDLVQGPETDLQRGIVKRLGTELQIKNIQKATSKKMDVRLNLSTPPICTLDGYVPVSGHANLTEKIVSYLNGRLDSIRTTITTIPGEWYDIHSLIKEIKQKFQASDSCRDYSIFTDSSAFVFIDKASPGKGVSKFITHSYLDSTTNTYKCKISFKQDNKYRKIDRGSIELNIGDLDKAVREGRWRMDYNKFINNTLSSTLNTYLWVTWASHEPLYKDYGGDGRKPNDSCYSNVSFISKSTCSMFDTNYYQSGKLDSWFYRWYFTPSPWLDPPKPFRSRNRMFTTNELDEIENEFYMAHTPCVNGKDHPVSISDIASFFSTLDFAFKVKDTGMVISKWLLDDGHPFTGSTTNMEIDYPVYQLFTNHAYLGKIGIAIRDPYHPFNTVNNLNNVDSLEIWMDNDTCAATFGSNFKLHIKFGGYGGDERIYNIPYPSAKFDKLVNYGYPDPGGCRTVKFNGRNDYFFDMIGGFYINDDGYLAFDDKQAGDSVQTAPDHVFTNVRLNCYNENCLKDTLNVFCMPCGDSASCGNMCIGWIEDRPEFTGKPVKFRLKTCEEQEITRIVLNIQNQINAKHKIQMDELRAAYFNQCTKLENINDVLTAKYGQEFYHYTLYYYDRAGRLVKTVPPKGVVPLDPDPADPVIFYRNETQHTFQTQYKYNSLGQMIWQLTPDGGQTNFWYDDRGKLRFSRNAKQAAISGGRYSYTIYDNLNRVIEVGEASGAPTQAMANNQTLPTSGIIEYTKTHYSEPPSTATTPTTDLPAPFGAGNATPRTQKFLLNRVSWTETVDAASVTTKTFYSYDPHGNVEWLIQDIPGLGASAIDYEYDLVSGKVTQVSYQNGFKDRYYHRYQYDEDNRIKAVETSKDQKIWERDASYDYYLHGPLRRTVTGRDALQGTDYTYTIQGWLKAINHPIVAATGDDPGGDGKTGSANSNVGVDAFGTTLTYYSGDFNRTGSPFSSSGSNSATAPITGSLYNGNISGWVTGYMNNAGNRSEPLAGIYQYDILNRIRSDNPKRWKQINGQYQWEANSSGYASTYGYDPNGNIMSLTRQDRSGTTIDNLTYVYNNPTTSNRLGNITDPTNNPTMTYDLKTQSTGNYGYDDIGNLITDQAEGITGAGVNTGILWNAAGKVTKVSKTDVNGNTTHISFLYDAMGNRIRKFVDNPTLADITTYYVRDASGNVMSTYSQNGTAITQIEVPLFGSDRVGLAKPNVTRDNGNNGANNQITDGLIFSRDLGKKLYEFKDHLGNVRTVVSDIKKRTATNNPFMPEVVSYSNYYPFGMQMQDNAGVTPSDTWQSSNYRYGYNGKEKDKEIHGEGNSYDFGARIYDPRVARWLSTDPASKMYPKESPYSYTLGNPIKWIDVGGKVVGDENGNVIYTVLEENSTFTLYNYKVGVTTMKELTFSARKVQILANDGTVLIAYIAKNQQFMQKTSVIEWGVDQNNQPAIVSQDVTESKLFEGDNSRNCGGNALCDRDLTIGTDLLTPDFLTKHEGASVIPLSKAKAGDFGTYTAEDGSTMHMELFLDGNSVSGKGGSLYYPPATIPGENTIFKKDNKFIIYSKPINTQIVTADFVGPLAPNQFRSSDPNFNSIEQMDGERGVSKETFNRIQQDVQSKKK